MWKRLLMHLNMCNLRSSQHWTLPLMIVGIPKSGLPAQHDSFSLILASWPAWTLSLCAVLTARILLWNHTFAQNMSFHLSAFQCSQLTLATWSPTWMLTVIWNQQVLHTSCSDLLGTCSEHQPWTRMHFLGISSSCFPHPLPSALPASHLNCPVRFFPPLLAQRKGTTVPGWPWLGPSPLGRWNLCNQTAHHAAQQETTHMVARGRRRQDRPWADHFTESQPVQWFATIRSSLPFSK